MSLLNIISQAETAGARLVADAEREHRDAQTLKAALEERVRAGDTGVQPGELGDATALIEHCALRITAARRQADQQVVDARHQAYAEVGQAAIEFDATDDPPILAAYAAAVDALRTLIEATETRSTAIRDLAAQAAPLLEAANDHQERGLLRTAGLANAGTSQGIGQPATLTVQTDQGVHRTTDAPAWQVAFAAVNVALEEMAARIGDKPWLWHTQTDLGPFTRGAIAAFPEMAPPDPRARVSA